MPQVPAWRSPLMRISSVLLLAVIAGCASTPPGSRTGPASPAERDGIEPNPPGNIAGVPDAEPRLETVRPGGPNKPYEVLGRSYVPFTDDRPFEERGLASWYGRKFHGRRTALGEVYDMYAMSAAHPTLPLPSYARVRNPANGREVVVRVNDRGPFHPGRIIDLSYAAAFRLDLHKGVAPVQLTRITFDDIRSGAWRRGAPADVATAERNANDVALAKPAQPVAESAQPPMPASAIEPAIDNADAPPAAKVARGFWVQLGAFRQRDGADGFRRRVLADLDWMAPLLGVFSEPTVYRLQAGPYASRDEARGVAERVREALQLVPVIVERR